MVDYIDGKGALRIAKELIKADSEKKEINMRYLYYCNSTYQLINTINLHWQRKYNNFEQINDYEGDLILLNAFKGAEQIIEKIKNETFFESVYLVNRVKNEGLFHSLKSFLDIAFPLSFLTKKYGFKKEEILNRYDVIVVPKASRITEAIWQVNKNAKIHIQEDGLGNYYFNMDLSAGSSSKIYKYFYKIFNSNKDFRDFEAFYLNKPELYTGNFKKDVKQIPVFDKTCLNFEKKIFSLEESEDDCWDKPIYWLSQYGFEENDDVTNEVLLNFRDDILLCRHPRHPNTKYNEYEKAPLGYVWELKTLNIDNIENKCLITVNSTACFSPKILFDLEPYIILTYKLTDDVINRYDENYIEIFEKFLNIFVKNYKDKNKIFVPESKEEFIKILDKILKSN